MRRILGRANSSNVMKVVWTLEELKVPYAREDYGGAFGKTQTDDYLAMNPNAVVPTLVEDDFVLWESNVITRYLAEAHAPRTPFWPHDIRQRANIERWMDWQQTTLGPPMTPVFWGLIRTPPEKRDLPAIHAAVARLADLYAILDRQLAKHDFVAGAALTPADICIGVHAHRWMSFESIDRPDHKNLSAWYKRLLDRPAYAQHVAQPLT